MRTLIATIMTNNKGREIYCWNRKVREKDSHVLRNTPQKLLEEKGFTFIRMISLEYPNIAGSAVFFEGHLDEIPRVIKDLEMEI